MTTSSGVEVFNGLSVSSGLAKLSDSESGGMGDG
jgi:hypothetical protein